jgi:hypothetical protein
MDTEAIERAVDFLEEKLKGKYEIWPAELKDLSSFTVDKDFLAQEQAYSQDGLPDLVAWLRNTGDAPARRVFARVREMEISSLESFCRLTGVSSDCVHQFLAAGDNRERQGEVRQRMVAELLRKRKQEIDLMFGKGPG